jgi:tetratricopeptide (TPR) repeat protein
VSQSSHPSLQEILDAFARLGERVSASPSSRLDPFVSISMRRACEELRRFIPGLDAPPDPEAARFLARAAYAAMEDNDAREALSRALRGLSFAPHHPGLYFVAATACFEFGAVEDALRLLRHTLWIHPGHSAARRDLEALSAYMQERWNSPGSFTSEEAAARDEAGATGPELAFDELAEQETGFVYDDEGMDDRYDEDEDRAA